MLSLRGTIPVFLDFTIYDSIGCFRPYSLSVTYVTSANSIVFVCFTILGFDSALLHHSSVLWRIHSLACQVCLKDTWTRASPWTRRRIYCSGRPSPWYDEDMSISEYPRNISVQNCVSVIAVSFPIHPLFIWMQL